MARRLQVGEQVARVLRAVVAAVGDALVAPGLGAGDLVGVLHAAAHEAHREVVRQVAGAQREVDRRTGATPAGPNISSSRGLPSGARSGSAPATRCACQLDAELGLDPQQRARGCST